MQRGVAIGDRLTLGRLVVCRRRWVVPTSQIPCRDPRLSEAEVFSQVNRWRKLFEIPDRVFVIEKISEADRKAVYKPQYIDFTSPLLVSVFQAAVKEAEITLEEQLPEPAVFPSDAAGDRWAIELQLDTLDLAATKDRSHRLAADGWPFESLTSREEYRTQA